MIKPLFDRILLSGVTEIESSIGLQIVRDKKDRPQKAKVVEIGDSVKHVQVGDTVLFSKYAPDEVQIGDEKYFIAREDQILAIIK